MILSRSCTQRTTRSGTVALITAVLLSTMLGMVGFAIDGGMIISEKRHAQSVADAAAMGGACILYQNFPSDLSGNSYNLNGSSHGAARTEAVNVAGRNGYSGSGANSAHGTSVSVNFPPNIGSGWPTTITSIYNDTSTPSSTYDGRIGDGCIEVQVFYWMPRYFTTVWGTDLVKIAARAVARGSWMSPKDGVIVLDYDPDTSLVDKGNGTVTVTGGGFVVNSSHPSAAVQLTGNGAIVAESFNVTGGVSLSGSNSAITTSPTSGQIFSGVHPTPDPLAYLPAPSQPADATFTQVGSTYTLPPGRYTSLPNFTNGDIVNFTGNGTYWFDTNFVSNGATLNGSNLLIYQNSGSFSVAGNDNGRINLSPQNDGVYQDLIFWQPTTNTNNISVAGEGGLAIRGTFYAPNALITVTGEGTTQTGNAFGSQFVSYKFKAAGNGNIDINYSGQNAAKARVLCLVE